MNRGNQGSFVYSRWGGAAQGREPLTSFQKVKLLWTRVISSSTLGDFGCVWNWTPPRCLSGSRCVQYQTGSHVNIPYADNPVLRV